MLISMQDVKDFLGISSSQTTDDDKIALLCQAAQDEADNAVGYTLEGSTFIEYQDGDGTDIIQLRNIPVKSITSIYDDTDWVYGADTLILSTDYTFNADSGIVRTVGLTTMLGVNNLKITYLAGYNGLGQSSYTNLPYDLRQAIIYLTSAMYLEGKAGVAVMEGQEIVYRPEYLKKEAYKTFDIYRRYHL